VLFERGNCDEGFRGEVAGAEIAKGV